MKHHTPTIQTLPTGRGRRGGFTIIELLVAIGVASLMLFLINFIFNDTTRAVSRGIALSDIISDTRGASDQFELDAAVMVGPTIDPANEAGGFLVITNHRVTAEVRRGPRGYAETRNAAHPDGQVRTDQLVFIRLRDDGTNLLLPIAPESNNTFSNDFGTGSPTDSYVGDHVKVWYGHVLQTGEDGIGTGDSLGSGGNGLSNDWILGRQAVFLVDETSKSLAAVHGQSSARYDGTVAGYGATTKPAAVTASMYTGLADMVGQVLGPQTTAGSVNADLNTGTYGTKALGYTYTAQRLWANPQPRIDPTNGLYTLASWQVAQMHPVFMNHISDFIVEFAADTNLDGVVDTDSNGDGTPDTTAGGNIMWYTHDGYANAATNSYALPAGAYKTAVYGGSVAAPHNAGASGAFVWRHNDANGAVTGSATQPSYWPYLIRIRYRAHDSRGIIESGTNQHGMWFEHIIKVNRP